MAQPRKLVVVLADGLRDDTARQCMGYLLALQEAGRARWATLSCALPGISRPLYATVVTGRTPLQHGILGNEQVGQAVPGMVFDALHAAGGRSCVAAYHWFRELLAGEAFVPEAHRHLPVPARGVVGASWYWEDDYPDSHLLADAEWLRRQHAPELLFIHPMGPDHAGHTHGGESPAYAYCARKLDMMLARLAPAWTAAGYELIVTSDHGMSADRMHGGSAEAERQVPFVWVPAAPEALAGAADWPEAQTEVAGFLCRRLGLDPAALTA
jgi:predicted AlkP superfamily pyrophosphatase or phosphodiesterase